MRYLLVTLVCVLLAGCGGNQRERRAAATVHPARSAPGRLLAVQRLGGLVATSETLTLDRNGAATLDRRHGGAGRRVERFQVTAERMRAIRRALARVLAHPPRQRAEDRARVTYTLWAAGHGYRAQEGRMDRRERPLFRALQGVIDGQARG